MTFWQRDAKCRVIPKEIMVPPKTGVIGRPRKDAPPRPRKDALEVKATRVCNGDDDFLICPVREQCLEFALAHNEKYGAWGGKTSEERRTIRARRLKAS